MLTALFDVDLLDIDNWVALWQRVGVGRGYRLMARRVPLVAPSAGSYIFQSYSRLGVSHIERVVNDGTDFKGNWFEPEDRVFSIAAGNTLLGPVLYFLVERAEDEAICRVNLDGSEFTVLETFPLGHVSHGPNALNVPTAGEDRDVLHWLDSVEGKNISVADDGVYAYFLDSSNPTNIWREVLDSGEPTIWHTLNEVEEGEGGEGQLTLLEPPLTEVTGGAADLCMSPDGKHIYVLLFNEDIVQFSRDAVTGLLTPLEPELVPIEEAKGQRTITISPDGNFVYVGIGGEGEDIAILSRDPETGLLTFVEMANFGFITTVASVVISPDGKHLYATTFVPGFENVLVQFSRNAETGKLTSLEPFQALNVGEEAELEGVAIAPDGASVYVTLSETSKRRIYQFSRDGETGLLSPIGAGYVVAPLGRTPTNPIVSSDGKNVYVSTILAGSVLQYARDTETGALLALAEGPESPGSFVVGMSHDGRNVYKADKSESPQVAQYLRDPETGLLTALEPPNTEGVALEGQPQSIYMAVSPDDKFVYLAGGKGVAMYARAAVTPPRFTLNKGLACDGTWLFFSGVGPIGKDVGRIRLDGTDFKETWLRPNSGDGPLAVDAGYLYFSKSGALWRVGRSGDNGSTAQKWLPAPITGMTPLGLATVPKPAVGEGGLELRLEKRLGGTSLLASQIVELGEGARELGFLCELAIVEIDGTPVLTNVLAAYLDGEPLIAGLDPSFLGGYIGFEGTRGASRGPPVAGGPGVGKLHYRLDARSYFDPFASDTPEHKAWMAAKIDRAIGYSPILSYIPRFPSTLFLYYMDAWTGDPFAEAKIQIDKASGRKEYLEYLTAKVEAGVEGHFFDDLNFAGGNRPTEEPESKAWKEGLGLLLEEIRTAHPSLFIEANPQYKDIWPLIKGGKALPLTPGSEAADADVERAVKAVDMFCKEFGIGPTSGIDTPVEYREVLEYAEWLHSRGVGLQWSPDKEASLALDEYQQASALLVANGLDSLSIYRAHPAPEEVWFKGQDMALGEPTGERERLSSGLWKRAFTNGVVYTVEPKGEDSTITLTETMVNSAGVTLAVGTKLTLKAEHGLLLLKVESDEELTGSVIGLRQLTMDEVLIDDLERIETPLGGRWKLLPGAIDIGNDTLVGWQPSSSDSGAIWDEWFGESPPPPKEPPPEPEGPPEDPATSVGLGSGGIVPFSRPVRR